MKSALKLVLIYFLLSQVAGLLVAMPYVMARGVIIGDMNLAISEITVPSLLCGLILAMIYLWRKNYLKSIHVDKSVVTIKYVALSTLMLLSSMWIISMAMSKMTWIPNLLEQSFQQIISSWVGIALVAVIGPIVEEYAFRGAITRVLLEKYSPTKAILISAAIFGLFHINPAQVVPAFFMGIILAWVYFRTASLIPVIIMHIINNSISVWLMYKYPDVKEVNELIDPSMQIVITIVAAAVLVGVYFLMKKVKVDYNWKTDEVEEQLVLVNENELNQ